MRRQATAIRYTIRGVPPDVDRVLRERAARRKQSLNRVVLDELSAASIGVPRKVNFSDIAGRRTPDPAFDEILATKRQIDWEKWK